MNLKNLSKISDSAENSSKEQNSKDSEAITSKEEMQAIAPKVKDKIKELLPGVPVKTSVGLVGESYFEYSVSTIEGFNGKIPRIKIVLDGDGGDLDMIKKNKDNIIQLDKWLNSEGMSLAGVNDDGFVDFMAVPKGKAKAEKLSKFIDEL